MHGLLVYKPVRSSVKVPNERYGQDLENDEEEDRFREDGNVECQDIRPESVLRLGDMKEAGLHLHFAEKQLPPRALS